MPSLFTVFMRQESLTDRSNTSLNFELAELKLVPAKNSYTFILCRYPLTEVQYINAQMARAHVEAATGRARQELEALSRLGPEQEVDLNQDALRQQSAERQRRIEQLRGKVQELGREQLTSLLQDMAALQVTRVLHGDYDLKLARQDYFTSKQDKVLFQ